ncbi:hypothetical protein FH972_012535 [Carpinus fangiana]|uniref:Uncharacterized protein n=1 Tax=Carpinus fangiana TaxID=176857 RepID=A0A5N6R440_9ROSI|nr:hypothetical protein FH972_012535 [Carpinus fangiana]
MEGASIRKCAEESRLASDEGKRWGQYDHSTLRALLQFSAPHTIRPPPCDSDDSPPLAQLETPPLTGAPRNHPPTDALQKSTCPDSLAKHEGGNSDGAPPTGAPRTDPPAVCVRFFSITHWHR